MVGSALNKRPHTLSRRSLATTSRCSGVRGSNGTQAEERADQFVLLVSGGATADLSIANVTSASVSSGHSEPDNLDTGAQTR